MWFRFPNSPTPRPADSPEARLLFACARSAHNERSLQSIRSLISCELDWEHLAALARRHRVRPLLLASLLKAGAQAVPDSFLQPLRDFSASNSRRSLFLVGELFRILDLFRAENIPVAPFKGPLLAMDVYGNPALREAGDLDLLVRRRDIVRARRLLIERGFSPGYPTATPTESAYLNSLRGEHEVHYLLDHCEHHLLREQGGVNVDLHWALALRQFALPLKRMELWKWLTPRTIGSRLVLTFQPEEMLLVLCINGAKDCWQRLDRICDVAGLLRANPEMNWRGVFERARKIGGMRMLCVGLKSAAVLLGSQLPTIVNQHISADKEVPTMVGQVRDGLFDQRPGEVEEAGIAKALFHLKLRDTLGDAISYVLAQFEPTVGDRAAIRLPHQMQFLHYATRPFRLAWRFGSGWSKPSHEYQVGTAPAPVREASVNRARQKSRLIPSA